MIRYTTAGALYITIVNNVNFWEYPEDIVSHSIGDNAIFTVIKTNIAMRKWAQPRDIILMGNKCYHVSIPELISQRKIKLVDFE